MTTIEVLKNIAALLQQASIAAPTISVTVMAIASIFKGLTGTGPPLLEIADMLEAQIGRTDATIRAEIARLEALPPAGPPPPGS